MRFAIPETPFSDAPELTDALFWDRRRPRLHTLPQRTLVATSAGEDACGPRRARPLVRGASLKGYSLF